MRIGRVVSSAPRCLDIPSPGIQLRAPSAPPPKKAPCKQRACLERAGWCLDRILAQQGGYPCLEEGSWKDQGGLVGLG
eukprot:387925-Pelagomonas_calceolata.AAC.1